MLTSLVVVAILVSSVVSLTLTARWVAKEALSQAMQKLAPVYTPGLITNVAQLIETVRKEVGYVMVIGDQLRQSSEVLHTRLGEVQGRLDMIEDQLADARDMLEAIRLLRDPAQLGKRIASYLSQYDQAQWDYRLSEGEVVRKALIGARLTQQQLPTIAPISQEEIDRGAEWLRAARSDAQGDSPIGERDRPSVVEPSREGKSRNPLPKGARRAREGNTI